MQLDSVVPPQTLPDVAKPPMLEVMLFEQPWALMAIISLTLIIVAWVLYRKSRSKFAAITLVEAVMVPGILWFLAHNTLTDREMLDERAGEAVAAIADWDSAEFDPMLSDQVRTVFFMARNGWDKDQLLSWIDGRATQYAVSDFKIKAVRTEITDSGNAARTRIEVRVTPESLDQSILFICMFEWIRQPPPPPSADAPTPEQVIDFKGWKIDTIRPLWIQGFGDISGSGR